MDRGRSCCGCNEFLLEENYVILKKMYKDDTTFHMTCDDIARLMAYAFDQCVMNNGTS